ncbi:DUF7146 domain-containing protein [Bradyrhizobium sp. 604_D8_N2_3]|uniref:DUF7146 domain-containing protein n=1 Tax=Bradyrhizobium sp. 604_D8_N2_3 TaxID=3240370 RepID=UPI003F23E547
MFLDGVGFREAVRTLMGDSDRLAHTPRPAPVIKPAETGNNNSMHRIWREAHDPRDTLVKTYFDGRGLELDDDLCGRVLRFHPCVKFGETEEAISIYKPALIAAFRPIIGDDETTPPAAIHRIFLNPDGSQLKKKMLAPVGGAAVKLDADTDVGLGLGIAEGIETALKIRATGWRPVWALGCADAIRTLPPMAGIECLTIFADNDKSGIGQQAADVCARRWAVAGCEVFVRIPPVPGTDWLEALS